MTTITVARVSAADLGEAARLLHAMECHYEGAAAATEACATAGLAAALGEGGSGFGMLVARSGGHAAGFATFSLLFPVDGLRAGLFVKDLFVAEPWRRQ